LFGQAKLIYDKLHDIGGELQKPLYAEVKKREGKKEKRKRKERKKERKNE
jgi:hypothetical protein